MSYSPLANYLGRNPTVGHSQTAWPQPPQVRSAWNRRLLDPNGIGPPEQQDMGGNKRQQNSFGADPSPGPSVDVQPPASNTQIDRSGWPPGAAPNPSYDPNQTGMRSSDFRDVDQNGIDDRDQPWQAIPVPGYNTRIGYMNPPAAQPATLGSWFSGWSDRGASQPIYSAWNRRLLGMDGAGPGQAEPGGTLRNVLRARGLGRGAPQNDRYQQLMQAMQSRGGPRRRWGAF